MDIQITNGVLPATQSLLNGYLQPVYPQTLKSENPVGLSISHENENKDNMLT